MRMGNEQSINMCSTKIKEFSNIIVRIKGITKQQRDENTTIIKKMFSFDNRSVTIHVESQFDDTTSNRKKQKEGLINENSNCRIR